MQRLPECPRERRLARTRWAVDHHEHRPGTGSHRDTVDRDIDQTDGPCDRASFAPRGTRTCHDAAMRRITLDERRARLARRHHLTAGAKADDPVTIADDLVGLHSSDPATVFLSAAARMSVPGVEPVERALYEQRSLVRTLCMRRTMFVVPVTLVAVVQAAVTDALVPGERRRLAQMIEQGGIAADGARWLRNVEKAAIAAIGERGEATGAELSKVVPGLAEQLIFGEGKTWGGKVGMSTRVLFLLSTEQHIVRGRPKGGWTSSQYRWAPMSTWLPAGVARPSAADARAELARRWLRSFGPGLAGDLKWWTGWTVAQTRESLAGAHAVEVELDDGGSGFVAPEEAARLTRWLGGVRMRSRFPTPLEKALVVDSSG